MAVQPTGGDDRSGGGIGMSAPLVAKAASYLAGRYRRQAPRLAHFPVRCAIDIGCACGNADWMNERHRYNRNSHREESVVLNPSLGRVIGSNPSSVSLFEKVIIVKDMRSTTCVTR